MRDMERFWKPIALALLCLALILTVSTRVRSGRGRERIPARAAAVTAVPEEAAPAPEEVSAEAAQTPAPTPPPIDWPEEEGTFFVGTKLYCVGADGRPVINGTYGKYLSFGPDGAYTTGDAELDELIQQELQQYVDPESEARMVMLRTLYNHVVDDFQYLRRSYYEKGETGWEAEEAKVMLSTRKGNCYNYAAVFGYLARAIGFDAYIYAGTVRGMGTEDHPAVNPHGWVEIKNDIGEWRLFDPEYEFTSTKKDDLFDRAFRPTYYDLGYSKVSLADD